MRSYGLTADCKSVGLTTQASSILAVGIFFKISYSQKQPVIKIHLLIDVMLA